MSRLWGRFYLAPEPVITLFDIDAAHVLTSGSDLTQMTDQSPRMASVKQPTSANRPDLNPTGINGLPAASFLRATQDFMTFDNMLVPTKDASALWFMAVMLLSDTANAHTILTYVGGTGVARWSITALATSRLIRTGSRRLSTDAADNTDSAIGYTAGNAFFVAATTNFTAGWTRNQLDDAINIKTIAAAGKFGWNPSGLGRTENRPSLTAPILGRTAGATRFEGLIACARGGIGPISQADITSYRLTKVAAYGLPLQTLALNAPATGYLGKVYRG